MSIETWKHFIKPEIRTSGQALFSKAKINITQPSDTEINLFIQVSSGVKVSFKTKSISSDSFQTTCTCSMAKKNQFCKHVWAAALDVQNKNPDFFENKTKIELTAQPQKMSPIKKSTEASVAFKEKQTLYRKIQYQKQKLAQKKFKESKKGVAKKSEFPMNVQNALNYFSENGFDFSDDLNKDAISAAKKKLARVFHPDLGGSHNEILELNEQANILIHFTSIKKF